MPPEFGKKTGNAANSLVDSLPAQFHSRHRVHGSDEPALVAITRNTSPYEEDIRDMAKRKAKRSKATRTTRKKASKARGRSRKASAADFIISKSRTKAAASINVSGDFYSALDSAVRDLIANAEARATNNNRRTLRPHDL